MLSFLLEGDDAGEDDDPLQCTVKWWKDDPHLVSAGTCCAGWVYSSSGISKLCNSRRTVIVHEGGKSAPIAKVTGFVEKEIVLELIVISKLKYWVKQCFGVTKPFIYMA